MSAASERSMALRDLPMSLEGCHGRIGAYRYALEAAEAALSAAVPYVLGVANDRSNAPWRIETAETTLSQVRRAREQAQAELAVTNP